MRPLRTILAAIFLLGMTLLFWLQPARAASPDQEPGPQPTPDRLAVPILPENPTQNDEGIQVYYYHCMPCHGDYGQGLTDEFSAIWPEDHQDCWDSGCHGGRERDEGFPIPDTIPSVQNLDKFPDPASLFSYLQRTHPPQYPGKLAEDEYWAVTAHLFYQTGRASLDDRFPTGSQTPLEENPLSAAQPLDEAPNTLSQRSSQTKASGLLALLAVILITSLALIRQIDAPH